MATLVSAFDRLNIRQDEIFPARLADITLIVGNGDDKRTFHTLRGMLRAHSPVFDAMAAKAFRDSGGGIGTFCTGCHAPFGRAENEPGTSDHEHRSPKVLLQLRLVEAGLRGACGGSHRLTV